MNITFHQSAFAEYQQWATDDIKVFKKLSGLINEITRTPFTGTGKPEPLKENLTGF
jgi:toxin YoeB